MSDYASVTFELADDVATIRLAQPDRGNPFDLTLCSEFSSAAERCDDPQVRAVLIEAEGRFFSVGGDLALLTPSRDEMERYIRAAPIALHPGVSRLARIDAPVVVAIDGLAAGVGVSIVAGADVVVAGPGAQFYAAYGGIGLGADGGGTYYLPRRVGAGRARSFYLRNQKWPAQQAHDWGLVDILVEGDPTAVAREVAQELAAGPTRAHGGIKRLMAGAFDTPLAAHLDEEARTILETARTDDAWEAINAVAAKERPLFRGR